MKNDLDAQVMVALDAIEAEDPRAGRLLAPIIKLVQAHGMREGRKDYEGRALDVESGTVEPRWTAPSLVFGNTGGNANDAYVDAVGINAIMHAIGLPKRMWEHVSDAWMNAFKRGYIKAYNEAQRSAQLDREITEALRRRSGRGRRGRGR